MSSVSRFRMNLICGAALCALTTGAFAAPIQILRPNIITTAGSVSATLNGTTVVNQGLQGVNRLSALTTKDFAGDTFGAYSGLDVLPGTWRKTATGYTGVLYSLPDRGPNGVGSVGFSDYAGRVNSFDVSFTPYTGTTALAANANVLQLTQKGGFFFKDFNGNVTTGLDPQLPGVNSFVTQNGINLPGSKIGTAAGKISLDAEALRFLNDGSFYVGDEYGANVYYFDKTGNMKAVVTPPPALVPRTSAAGTTPDTLSFTTLADAAVGRRFNQGIEGMAVTPDNKKLATLLQSATYQDTNGTQQQTRTNTRLMIYDITGTKAPTAPIADYVLQLPVLRSTGDGGAVDRTAAQSELLALNDTQFLVLSRDGNGLGQANLNPVFKSILLVDTAGATNIAGTPFETSYTPISPGGVLVSSITPVQQTEVVNILNTTQLSKFGINLNNGVAGSANPANATTLTEKFEGMALVPTLEEGTPQDYFLLVGNDNDFLSSTCNTGGIACAQGVNSDAVVLVYRLTLPTYVDSQFLQSMITSAPATMSMSVLASRQMAVSADIGQHLEVRRHDNGVKPAQSGVGLSVWAGGNWATQDETAKTLSGDIYGATVGLDAQLDDSFMVGVAAGMSSGNSSSVNQIGEQFRAIQVSLYGAFERDGFFADVSGTYSDQRFRNINRAAAYGLTATGDTNGAGWGFTGEVGYLVPLEDDIQLGPVAGFQVINTDVNGYAESGAAGGNVLFPALSRDTVNGFFGGEASAMIAGLRAIFRLTYNTDDGYDAQNATVSLINASNVMGTQGIVLPSLGQAHIAPSLTVTGDGKDLNWFVNYGANIGVDNGVQHHVSGGLKLAL